MSLVVCISCVTVANRRQKPCWLLVKNMLLSRCVTRCLNEYKVFEYKIFGKSVTYPLIFMPNNHCHSAQVSVTTCVQPANILVHAQSAWRPACERFITAPSGKRRRWRAALRAFSWRHHITWCKRCAHARWGIASTSLESRPKPNIQWLWMYGTTTQRKPQRQQSVWLSILLCRSALLYTIRNGQRVSDELNVHKKSMSRWQDFH